MRYRNVGLNSSSSSSSSFWRAARWAAVGREGGREGREGGGELVWGDVGWVEVGEGVASSGGRLVAGEDVKEEEGWKVVVVVVAVLGRREEDEEDEEEEEGREEEEEGREVLVLAMLVKARADAVDVDGQGGERGW
jgi:hypothetical protein